MTIRSELAWASSPTKEYVTADRMNEIGLAFGSTRLIGMSTPGIDVTAANGGVAIDYPQSGHLRICLVGKRAAGSTDPGELYINVKTRAETGGPSEDYGDYWTPTSKVTKTPLHIRLPGQTYKDPQTWVESGRDDNKFDTNGFLLHFWGNQLPFVEQLFWIQLCLLSYVGPRYVDTEAPPSFVNRDRCSPGHQKLWLYFDPDANMEYVRNILVWEWIRHPETPTFNYNDDIFAYSQILDKSEASENMGSKYDLFTGN